MTTSWFSYHSTQYHTYLMYVFWLCMHCDYAAPKYRGKQGHIYTVIHSDTQSNIFIIALMDLNLSSLLKTLIEILTNRNYIQTCKRHTAVYKIFYLRMWKHAWQTVMCQSLQTCYITTGATNGTKWGKWCYSDNPEWY